MDEFNRAAWEMDRALNRYHRIDPVRRSEDPPRCRKVGGLLLASIVGFLIGLLLIWAVRATWDDLAEHFKSSQPVEMKQEASPDIMTTIRGLEQVLADAKHLNSELLEIDSQLRKNLERMGATARVQQP